MNWDGLDGLGPPNTGNWRTEWGAPVELMLSLHMRRIKNGKVRTHFSENYANCVRPLMGLDVHKRFPNQHCSFVMITTQ